MTTVWIAIAAVALANATIKAAGPVAVGRRELPPAVLAVIGLLAPALLTALVVAQTFTQDGDVLFDAKVVGVGVGALALVLRAPMLLAISFAAATTALVRALG